MGQVIDQPHEVIPGESLTTALESRLEPTRAGTHVTESRALTEKIPSKLSPLAGVLRKYKIARSVITGRLCTEPSTNKTCTPPGWAALKFVRRQLLGEVPTWIPQV